MLSFFKRVFLSGSFSSIVSMSSVILSRVRHVLVKLGEKTKKKIHTYIYKYINIYLNGRITLCKTDVTLLDSVV